MNLHNAVTFFSTVVCLVGCGEPTATVSGVVNIDGKPMAVADNVRGTVVFQPSTRQGPTLNGSIEDGGGFQLMAGSNRLVAPGVYLATVSATELLPANEEAAPPGGKRITPEKYAKSDESGLRFVINPGENNIVIEIETEQPAEEAAADAEAPATDVQTEPTTDKN
jgi:hypothetical protein